MSSDNFNRVEEQEDGRWFAWQNLDASHGEVPESPQRVFASFEEAFQWADDCYAEYGTSVGFSEKSKP